MSANGKGTRSLRKADIANQRIPQVGFRKLVFAHKATNGETGISLSNLTTPSEMSSAGFVQATNTELTAAKLLFFRKNLKLVSSLSGVLQDYLSYNVASNTQINFSGFTAQEGEIFVGIVDHEPTSGLQVVDANPIISAGDLDAGTDTFNVGEAFEVNKYSTTQIGAVLVFRDGVLQMRNTNNAAASPSADGNYQEIDNGIALSTQIKFNVIDYSEDNSIVVISNGLLVNRPSESRDQAIEALAASLDNVIADLAIVTGNPTTSYQGQPTKPDLTIFGDRVYRLETSRIVVTADTLAVRTAIAPYDFVQFDTNGGAGTFVAPANPTAGQTFEIWDATGTWGTVGKSMTINFGSQNVEGVAIGTMTISTANVKLKFSFVNPSRGWNVGDLS